MLMSASNGGRILDEATHILTINANDNPHGTIEFQSDSYSLSEPGMNSSAYISVIRKFVKQPVHFHDIINDFTKQRYNTPYKCNVINNYYLPILAVVSNH